MNSKNHETEEEVLLAVSALHRTSIIELNESISLLAADLSLKHGLPMADAIVYATALEENCRVVTSDTHFKGLAGVIFIG